MMTIENWKNIAQASQSITTCLGIIVGGFWTYFIFIKKRLSYPRIKLDMSWDVISVPKNKNLIHAKVTIDNTGTILFEADEAELRLRRVVPIPSDIEDCVVQNFDPVQQGRSEIEWPEIAGRTWKWNPVVLEIEPGETDTLHSDFIIDSSVNAAQFYFFIKNKKKSKKQLGWPLTKVFTISIQEVEKMERQQENKTAQVPQQKQQQPQKPQKPIQQKPPEKGK